MDFKLLLKNAEQAIEVPEGVEVCSLHHDSRTVKKGGLFFALDGTKKDGAKFIKQAVKNGAVAVIHSLSFTPDEKGKKQGCVYVGVDDVRMVMSLVAKAFYGGYCDQMKMIAVVGTNGKTTIVNMLSQVLGCGGSGGVGTIGTLGVDVGGVRIATGMTTPDPIDLHRIIKEMFERGVRTVVMEVSAHAIHFRKMAGVTFDIGVFTNVSRDHLDFFETFESYCNTKLDFFIRSAAVKHAVVNIDCSAGVRIFLARSRTCTTYSIGGRADFAATGVRLFPSYSEFVVDKTKVHLNIPASFNISNALSVIAVARQLGVNMKSVCESLRTLKPIAGRYNTFAVKDFIVVIDYAHTPDGLSKLIESARKTMGAVGKIITVFGCGGDRDKGKRPLMGKVAAELSDFVVVTSDNPRGEGPLSIMHQIEGGIKPFKDYALVEDRAYAIEYALNMASCGDVVIIAGKGGEEFQEIRGVFHKYSDEEIVASAAAQLIR